MEGLRKRKAESPLMDKRLTRTKTKTSPSPYRTKTRHSKTSPSRQSPYRTKTSASRRSPNKTKRSRAKRSATRSATRSGIRSATRSGIRSGTTRSGIIRSGTMTRNKANAASRKISQFFKQTKYTRKANYLMTVNKSLCSDAGVCLAFGTLADVIKQHFQGFTKFAYVQAPIMRIGKESANGFINQINYSHRGYKACALLKSSKTEDSDNLLYEYVVGQYINKQNKQFPCFLETYGYYIYKNEDTWLKMQNEPVIEDISVLKGLSNQGTIDYNDACRESKKLAILIQYFQGIQSLQKMSLDPTFIQSELMAALFQLYVPLARLKDTFTHYDLHLENVYLYKPVEGKYIEYHYYLSSTRAVSFKSSYMVKIIDYGRSFFKDGDINSKMIYEKELCDYASDCNEPEEVTGECGRKVGFGWLKKLSANPKKDFYISAQRRNMSHDLLPLTRIAENHEVVNGLTPELKSLVKKVVYTDYYGTGEIEDHGYPNAIYNVQDAADFITVYMKRKKFIDQNEMDYAGKEKLGDLHVYTDGREMEFIPATSSEV